jgi:1-acyl-sn-glycerol-3-phosphate acyltransferase
MDMNIHRRRNLLYKPSRALIHIFASLMLRFQIQHNHPLPPGPKLFVANHPSATDPFLIHLATREELNVMITEKAFQVPWFGWFLRKVQEIPVPISLEGGVAAIEQARHHLAAGCSVAIFIEGLISPEDGSFHMPRTGASRLVLGSEIPVIPVGIYLRRNWRLQVRAGITGEQTEAYWYLHGPYVITVGQPMYFRESAHSPREYRQVAEQVMTQVKALAAESEQRGSGIMKNSLLVQFYRFLAPLWRRKTTAIS